MSEYPPKTPWYGDWQERLSRKLEELGFSSLEAYLTSQPGVGYVKIARILGIANVCAMQIYGMHLRAAAAEGRVREAAIDSLVRLLAEHLTRGWGTGQHFPFKLALAFATWVPIVERNANPSPEVQRYMDRVFESLKAIDPPKGWVPEGPDDAIIRTAFDQGWPD